MTWVPWSSHGMTWGDFKNHCHCGILTYSPSVELLLLLTIGIVYSQCKAFASRTELCLTCNIATLYIGCAGVGCRTGGARGARKIISSTPIISSGAFLPLRSQGDGGTVCTYGILEIFAGLYFGPYRKVIGQLVARDILNFPPNEYIRFVGGDWSLT